MRILQLATHLNAGGVARYIVSLSRHLTLRGHKVSVASSGGDMEGELEEAGIPHLKLDIRTKSELSPRIPLALLRLIPFIKSEGVELIHSHTRVTQVTGAILSRLTEKAYVSTCHGFFKERLGRRLFGCWGKPVIAISRAVKSELIERFGVDDKDVELVYTGVEDKDLGGPVTVEKREACRRRFGISLAYVVGTVGRLSPVKGQGLLLEVLSGLKDKRDDILLMLAGDGPEKKRLLKKAADLGISDRVRVVCGAADVGGILECMDVFALPSVEEGLGLALAEAMAKGIPCVASRVGGIEDLIKDGYDGILAEPNDLKGFSHAIEKLLNNDQEVRKMAGRAREKIKNEFNMEKMLEGIERAYYRALHKKEDTA